MSMHRNRLRMAASLALTWPAACVQAQSCASPLPMSNAVPVAGNTCTGADPFPLLGLVPSPQRDLVYRFGLDGQTNASIAVSAANFVGVAAAFAQCVPSSEPIAVLTFGLGPSGPMVLTGLPAGDYTLVVTAHPDQLPAACGQFSLLALGVGSDPIFASGFQSD